jgi:dienelactone hydrolase
LNGSLMCLYVAQPQPEGRWPGLLFYSDIFSLVIRSRAWRIA